MPRHRTRWRSPQVVLAIGLALLALVVLLIEPWHGPVLLVVSAGHGVDAGDLLALPVLFTAAAVATKGRLGLPARAPAVLVVGALLVVLAVLWRSGAGPVWAPVVLAASLPAYVALERLVATQGPPGILPIRWDALVAVFAIGSVADAWVAPRGTCFGATILAASLVVRGRRAAGRTTMAFVTVALAVIDAVSLTDLAGLDYTFGHRGGGDTRTMALGAVLIVAAAWSSSPAKGVGQRSFRAM